MAWGGVLVEAVVRWRGRRSVRGWWDARWSLRLVNSVGGAQV